MKLDSDEITAIADALAPRVADILEARLSESPAWAMSIPEAAAWARVPEDAIRHAMKSGELPAVRIGRNVRIRRSDLFAIRPNGEPQEDGE
ncbi:MAG TPA: helix-turn-helix domain-containing protein [Thermoguttaceae bacterium]|nr:helix-turn-helix domain-containing protein [Thermoguttaceae bacterium]